jgi:hypothetical protein
VVRGRQHPFLRVDRQCDPRVGRVVAVSAMVLRGAVKEKI